MAISVLLAPAPAPGWYADPVGQAAYRWWDGDGWTEGTHAGTTEPAPRVPIELFADVSVPDVEPQPQPKARAPRPEPRRGAAPAKTRWSSLLVAFPFVYPFAVGMVVALAYAGGAASNPIALVIIGAVVAVAALVPAWIFADHDRRELLQRGYEPAPSIGWMAILPPVAYLIARRRVVGPSY